jgi:replication factor A1
MNVEFEEKRCKNLSIIELEEVTANHTGQKNVIFILKMRVVKLNVDSIIGNPVLSKKFLILKNFQVGSTTEQAKETNEPKTTKPLIPTGSKSVPPKKEETEVVHQNEYKGRMNTSGNTSNKKKNYSGDETLSVQPISSLNPYQPNWCIQARVTKKSDIKEWKKPNSTGKLFSVDLLDEEGEVRAVMFNNAVDQFYDIFQEGMVFIISKGSLKNANRTFSNINNDYEITLDEQSIVKPVKDDQNVRKLNSLTFKIPQIKYTLMTLKDLTDVPENQVVDVLVVVKNVGALSEMVAKSTNKPFKKKALQVCDDSGVQVELTLWGSHAEHSNLKEGDIALFKSVKKSNFGGVSLGTLSQSSITINPQIDQAHSLRGWYNKGSSDSIQSLTVKSTTSEPTMTIASIKDDDLGKGEKADFIKIQGTITYVKHESNKDMWYDSCPDCNKKMTQQSGGYRCDTCNQDRDSCVRKYIVSFIITDHTGNKWATAFGDAGTTIFGVTADELFELRETNNDEFQSVLLEANFKEYTFVLRVKEESNGKGDTTIKVSVSKIWPIDFVKGSKALIREIQKYQ